MATEFETFLKEKLKKIQLDEAIFGDYIRGILEDQISNEEKSEALGDILAGVLESNIEGFIEEIIRKWNDCHPVEAQPAEKPPEIDVDERLVKLLESQKLATNQVREYTDEEKKIREQILSQYRQVEVEEDDEPVDSGGEGSGSGALVKNTNVLDVQQRIKERRENAKLESQMKKQKDKEDREKQKQLREEKKEKRKTVKGERKR